MGPPRFAAALLLALAALAARPSAQDAAPRGAALPERPEAARLVLEIDSLIRAGDWDRAVDALARAAERIGGDEHDPVIPSGGRLSIGFGERLRRYPGLLPAEAFERYRARLDAILERAWKEAELLGADRLRSLRSKIVREHPEASSYRRALEEEIDAAVEIGAWEQARRLCEAWIEAAESRWAKEAVRAEDRARASALLGDLRARARRPAPADLPGGLESPGRPGAPYAPGNVLWELASAGRRSEDFVPGREREAGERRVPIAFQPAARDDCAVFRHRGVLAAVELPRGTELWRADLPADDETFDGARAPLVGEARVYDVARDRLYALSRADGRILWARRFEVDAGRRALRALPAAPEPDRGGGEAARLRYALSPPTFLDGGASGRLVLAVATREEREVPEFLACLDPDGETVWTTFLGSARSSVYLGLGDAPSAPASRDGTVYVVTNTGIVAAADVGDGTLLWLYEYPRLVPAAAREAVRAENPWHANPVLFAGPAALVAPRDAAVLLALDARTGETLWTCPRQVGSVLAGADDRACYVYGSEALAIACFGEERGRVLWRTRLHRRPPDGGSSQAFGRGFLERGVLFVPAGDALYRISAEDGSVLSRTLWGYGQGPGNLALSGRTLAVAGARGSWLTGDAAAAEEEFSRADPSDPDALLRLAEFRLRRVELAGALDALGRWERLGAPRPLPNSPRGKLQLDVAELARTIVEAGDAEGEEAATLFRHRLRLEVLPERRVAAAIDLASRLEAAGDAAGAAYAYGEALREASPETEYRPRPPLSVSARAYARAGLRALRSRAPPAAFERFDRAAEAALAAARSKGSLPAYEEVLRLFPYTPAAEAAAVELALAQLSRGNASAARGALADYLSESPAPAVGARLLLVELLEEAGRDEDARRLRDDLLRAHGGELVPRALGARGSETVAEYLERLDTKGAARAKRASEELRFPLAMSWRGPADLESVGRDFLHPAGKPPKALRDAFLVQSVEAIECRDLETGLPSWKIRLDLVPGFRFRDTGLGFRFPRSGGSLLRGRYVGETLVLSDDLNVFAVDTSKGLVSWHVPAGSGAASARAPEGPVLQRLRERWLGVGISEGGVFAALAAGLSERSPTLRRLSLSGETVWTRELAYEPAPRPLAVAPGSVFVHAVRPAATFVHDPETGEAVATIAWPEPIDKEPVELPGARLLVSGSQRVHLLDLDARKVRWTFGRSGFGVELVTCDASAPDECLVLLRRAENPPRLVALALEDGRELWRYDAFSGGRAYVFVARDGDEIFVLSGERGSPFEARWDLAAFRVSKDPAGPGFRAASSWPASVHLGTLLGAASRHRLHLAADAVLVSDPPASILLYDRALGVRKSAIETPLSQFLVEKGDFSSEVLGGKLVVLTARGDCAFEAKRPDAGDFEDPKEADLVRSYLKRPGDARTAAKLALRLFRDGKIDRAVALLDEVLRSEDAASAGADEILRLEHLLHGFKEEEMKREVPRIVCRRAPAALSVDGELSEPWDVESAVRLERPQHVRRLPGSSSRGRWEGEEDLSAIVYTAWDDAYFYVAMDVSDDVLHPYDRDAENWRGDCLVIGIDSLGDGGYLQRGDDQLMTLALTLPRRGEEEGEGGEGEEGEGEEAKPEGLYSVKKKDDDSGAVYEFGIPWSSFSSDFAKAPPPPGTVFGLSLLLLDDDTGQGVEKTLSWNPCHLIPRKQKSYGAARHLIPYFFPRVVLE